MVRAIADQNSRAAEWFSFLSRRTFDLFVVGLLFVYFADAQPPAAPGALQPGERRALELPPSGKADLIFTLSANSTAVLMIEQMQGTVAATVDGPGVATPGAAAMDPRVSDAGAHAIIRIYVVSQQGGEYGLHLQSRDKRLPVLAKVWIDEVRGTTTADSGSAEAEASFAHGEALRRTKPVGWQQSAINGYDRAIVLSRMTQDHFLERQALVGKARIYIYGLGDYTSGLEFAQQAVEIPPMPDSDSDTPEDLPFQALAWKTLSSAFAFLARYPEFISATDKALALYARLGDLYWQGVLQGNLGNVYLETGDTAHALAASEAAHSIARQLSDTQGIAFTEITIAAIHQTRGEYQSAFDSYDQALDTMMQAPEPDEEGQAWMNLAQLYDELDDAPRERAALNRSLPLLRQVQDTANLSSVLLYIGLLDLHEGHIEEAEKELAESRQIAKDHDLHREQAQAFLGEAELFEAKNQLPRALQSLQNGLELALKTHEAEIHAELLQAKGDLLAGQRNMTESLQAYRMAESEWSGLPNKESSALARASIAKIEYEQGNLAAAYRDILVALDGFEASRNRIGARLLRRSFFASRHAYYDLAVEIAMRLHQSAPSAAANYGEAAWKIAERARARSLTDEIRGANSFSTLNVPQSLLNKSADLERSIDQAQKTISSIGSGNESRQELSNAERKLHTLVEEADELDARERKFSSTSVFSGEPASLSLGSIRNRLLTPNSALLEYWIGRHSVYAWLITRYKFSSLQLTTPRDLDLAIQRYQTLLLARESHPVNEDFHARNARIARADSLLDQQARLLGRMLVPAELGLNLQQLIVVPDGALFSVPYAALQFPSGDYIVKRYEVVEEPSAGAALAIQVNHLQRAGNRIAVFADPVYNTLDARLHTNTSLADGQGVAQLPQNSTAMRELGAFDTSTLPRLKSSSQEALAIAKIAGPDRTDIYMGFQATPELVQQTKWNSYAAADFAAHALVNTEDPELSGIVLSMVGPDRVRRDGILWLHDIYRIFMPVSLVTLSGCRTARGKVIPGEGIAGLAQAFLSSKASGVVGSLWEVEDEAASRLIPKLYAGVLQEHRSGPDALRAAQLGLLADPARRSPYFWAGYIFEGSWQAN